MLKKKLWRPALASFFIVGFGQLLKGQGKKGLKLLLVFYFALPSLVYLALIISGWLFILVLALALLSAIILWVYNIWDAFTD